MTKKMWYRIFKSKSQKNKVLCNNSGAKVSCGNNNQEENDCRIDEDGASPPPKTCAPCDRDHDTNLKKYQTSSMGGKSESINAGGAFTKVMHSFVLRRNLGSAAKNHVVHGDISNNIFNNNSSSSCHFRNSIYQNFTPFSCSKKLHFLFLPHGFLFQSLLSCFLQFSFGT